MKRILIFAVVSIFALADAAAQDNIAFIDSRKILEAVPSYVTAQNEIDALANQYQQTIQEEISKIENLYNSYQAGKASLPASRRTAIENQIISKENAVQQKQQLYFGEDGIIPKKSEQLLDPIRKKMDEVLENEGRKGGYTMIIDIAVSSGVAYYNADKDISQTIINILNNKL